MQIVEISRESGEYKKADRTQWDLVESEDDVRVATLLDIYNEDSLAIYLSKNGLSLSVEAACEN